MGHLVCLSIKKDVYQQLKKQKTFADYLTPERISDIVALHEGVFFFYSSFESNITVGHRQVIDGARYFFKVKQKERYLVATYAATRGPRELSNNLGMRIVFRNTTGYEHMDAESSLTLYEIELDFLMRSRRPFWALGWTIEGDEERRGMAENLHGKAKWEGLSAIADKKTNTASKSHKKNSLGSVPSYDPLIDYDPLKEDNSLIADKRFFIHDPIYESDSNQNDQERMEVCTNPECTCNGKKKKGNIVFNGTYRTKGGSLIRRFLCKACNKVFCSREGTIFYDLRSPEEKVMKALTLSIKGMSLRSMSKTVGVELDTVRHWLKVAAEQSRRIDSVLIKNLKVSQV